QIEMQLRHELKEIDRAESPKSPLITGINNLLKEISFTNSKTKPWRATWKLDKAEALSQACKSKASLLVKACEYGATCTAWFMWRSGVNTSMEDSNGQLPLLAAINHKHWDTVHALVSYMGCNPFIRTAMGGDPFQLIPQKHRQTILQKMSSSEFNRLNNSISSAKDHDKKIKMKKMTLLFISLYFTFSEREEKISWKELYSCTLELLSVSFNVTKLMQDTNFDEKDDRLIWGHQLCQKISNEFEFNSSGDLQEFEYGSLPEFLSCLKQLGKKITSISNEKYKLQKKDGEHRCQIVNTEKILIQAMEFSCEKKSPLFLHMLIVHAQLEPNAILDEMLETRALHHASAEGNAVAVTYLINACDINSYVLDRNGNNAAHYAYMNGHINTGNFLLESKPKLTIMENNSLKTPLHLKEAYKDRVEQMEFQQLEAKLRDELNEKLQVVCEQSNESELTNLLLELSMFKKDVRKSTFKELALEKLVDYNNGEGRLIYKEIVCFIGEVGKCISMNNEYLRGKLIPVGSSADGCRLGAPDESDFNWVLEWEDIEAKLEEIPIKLQAMKGYTHKIVLDSKDQEIKKLIFGSNLLDDFQEAVKDAIPKCLNFNDNRLSIVLPGVKRTGVGMALTLAWMGSEHKLLLVDVDLVPVIKTARPPGYPHPPLTAHLSDSAHSLKHTIEIAGSKWEFYAEELHAAYINSIGNGYWRFSQALEENYIMLNLSIDQKNVFVISKYLISNLKAEPWYPVKTRKRFWYFNSKMFKLPTPQGFLLKSSFFKELERVPEHEKWHAQYYLDRIKCIILHMCRQKSFRDKIFDALDQKNDIKLEPGELDSGKVPSYFASSTQMQTAGYLAPFIFKKLNTMKIEDFLT
ncbi:unnamed protein product, partial [Meganyctiphanes norvegica]